MTLKSVRHVRSHRTFTKMERIGFKELRSSTTPLPPTPPLLHKGELDFFKIDGVGEGSENFC